MILTVTPTRSSTNKIFDILDKRPSAPHGGSFFFRIPRVTMDIEKSRDEKCCKQFIWKGSN